MVQSVGDLHEPKSIFVGNFASLVKSVPMKRVQCYTKDDMLTIKISLGDKIEGVPLVLRCILPRIN